MFKLHFRSQKILGQKEIFGPKYLFAKEILSQKLWSKFFLDRVEFERYRQKEGEDFESFYIATQQLAFDADLVNNHCAECSKKCLESRVANKLMAGFQKVQK